MLYPSPRIVLRPSRRCTRAIVSIFYLFFMTETDTTAAAADTFPSLSISLSARLLKDCHSLCIQQQQQQQGVTSSSSSAFFWVIGVHPPSLCSNFRTNTHTHTHAWMNRRVHSIEWKDEEEEEEIHSLKWHDDVRSTTKAWGVCIHVLSCHYRMRHLETFSKRDVWRNARKIASLLPFNCWEASAAALCPNKQFIWFIFKIFWRTLWNSLMTWCMSGVNNKNEWNEFKWVKWKSMKSLLISLMSSIHCRGEEKLF